MPADKRECKNGFNETGIKHFHKSCVNIKTAKLAINTYMHTLMYFFTHSIDLRFKAELVIQIKFLIFKIS